VQVEAAQGCAGERQSGASAAHGRGAAREQSDVAHAGEAEVAGDG
jgi:hypothetical protein